MCIYIYTHNDAFQRDPACEGGIQVGAATDKQPCQNCLRACAFAQHSRPQQEEEKKEKEGTQGQGPGV